MKKLDSHYIGDDISKDQHCSGDSNPKYQSSLKTHSFLFQSIYSGNPLDRLNNFRKDETTFKTWRDGPDARFVLFSNLKPLLDKEEKSILWFENSTLSKVFSPSEDKNDFHCGLLGKLPNEQYYYFAIDVSSKPEVLPEFSNGKFCELRAATPNLNPTDVAILAQARSMIFWHSKNQFCSICGHKTILNELGTRRDCLQCKANHFPRTDPVAIMLVYKGNKCLLGRKKEFPKGSYSCLAGFIEQGETIEEAVAREVVEESGIKIGKKITYIGSQPWPYPSQLMIGCLAEAETETITIDEELEDVQWFDKETVRKGLEVSKDYKNYRDKTEFRIPPYFTIANQLVTYWVNFSNCGNDVCT